MKAVVSAVLAASLAPLVAGHGYMSFPAPRARTIPGHRFRYEPQSDGARNGQCQDGGKTGPIQVTWTAGQTINITGTITADHNGWIEMRVCNEPVGSNACFERNRLVTTTPSSTPGGQAPAGSTDSVLQDARFRVDRRHGQTSWILPAGFTCDHCSMQWWWITQNYGFEHFKSCHDVRIVAKKDANEEDSNDGLAVIMPVFEEEVEVEDKYDEVTQPYCSVEHGVRFTGPVIDSGHYSPSKCCDACASMEDCLAWETHMVAGSWQCSLLSSVTGYDKEYATASGFAMSN